MIYEILDGETVINTISADAEFMATQYPDGNYREFVAPELPALPEVRHITVGSFLTALATRSGPSLLTPMQVFRHLSKMPVFASGLILTIHRFAQD
jgi:hypothetical protein